jgi:putative transposase
MLAAGEILMLATARFEATSEDNLRRVERSDFRLPVAIHTSENSVLRRPVESAQYVSDQFQRLMADHNIICSTSW